MGFVFTQSNFFSTGGQGELAAWTPNLLAAFDECPEERTRRRPGESFLVPAIAFCATSPRSTGFCAIWDCISSFVSARSLFLCVSSTKGTSLLVRSAALHLGLVVIHSCFVLFCLTPLNSCLAPPSSNLPTIFIFPLVLFPQQN